MSLVDLGNGYMEQRFHLAVRRVVYLERIAPKRSNLRGAV